jgi:hypothetical protein
MLEVAGYQIETVAIVDDDESSRASLTMCVDDAPVDPYPIDGPLAEGVEAAFRSISAEAQGCICDHQLQTGRKYAFFSGAALAAWNNQHDLPSILCTRFLGSDSQMPIIRGFLKHIPVLRRPEQLEGPDDIVGALRACASELSGTFTPQRRSWRTQVVVEHMDPNDRTVSLSLPAWQVDDPIRVRIDDVPSRLHEVMKIGYRTFVRANIGETHQELLYIDWQTE